jgi:hypothetical protein
MLETVGKAAAWSNGMRLTLFFQMKLVEFVKDASSS